MKKVIFFNVFLYGFISLLILSGCMMPQGTIEPVQGDQCAQNLYKLQSYDKSNAVTSSAMSWTKCIAECELKAFLTGGEEDCKAKCNSQVDTKKIVNNFISTSEEEQMRLRQINLEIDRLQQCRNQESRLILAGLKSKNSVRRKNARADYKVFVEKVQNDNRLLDKLLAASGERISEHEKTMTELNKMNDDSGINVRAGYNIRSAPSTKTGQIIGKTGSRATIRQVQGRWVCIDYLSHEKAYVHIKAFPSLSPGSQTAPGKKNNAAAHEAHVATQRQHAESVEKKSDYASGMDLRLSELDEASIS